VFLEDDDASHPCDAVTPCYGMDTVCHLVL